MVTRAGPRSALPAALALVAWILTPHAASAGVVTVKNLTADAITVCSMVRGAAACFTSVEVPPYGTTSLNLGASCLERWKATRARDGLALSGPPARSGCGDVQLLIRPEGARFTVGSP
jgi:hypothetical protein